MLVQLALTSQTSSLQTSIFMNTIDLQRVTELREKILASLLDNEVIICGEQLFPFFLTGAAMGAVSVGAIRINVTIMASFAAFVDI